MPHLAQIAAAAPILEAKRLVEYHELASKRLLNRTTERMPFTWTINPYRGCEFGCKYCFARYTHEFLEQDAGRGFETLIYAKQFSPASFRAELAQIDRKEWIAMGTATDPYQPAERRFGLTRRILEAFAAGRGRRLSLTTKSDLATRDLDLIQELARSNMFHLNLTVTTVDEALARLLEPLAPRPALRLETARRFTEAGIEVGVFLNPVMPGLTDNEEDLDRVAEAAKAAGATFLYGGPLFLKPCSSRVFIPFLDRNFPHLVSLYRKLYGRSAFLRGEYAEELKERVRRVRERHGLQSAPAEHTPELWPREPEQGALFD